MKLYACTTSLRYAHKRKKNSNVQNNKYRIDMMHAMPYVLISTFIHTHTHASNAKRYLSLASSHYGKLRCCAVNRWVGVRMYVEQNRIFVQCVRRPENIRFASSSSSSSMFDLALSHSHTHTHTGCGFHSR